MQKLNHNLVTFGGNLVADPVSHLVGTARTTRFQVSVDNGTEKSPRVTTLPCVAACTLADQVLKWFAKNDRIIVNGSLRSESLPGKQGSSIVIIVTKVNIIEDPNRGSKPTMRSRLTNESRERIAKVHTKDLATDA